MASNTERLGLLKKDSILDGADTFNVETILNDNWNKIDKLTALIDPVTGKLLSGQENPVDVLDIQTKLDNIETPVGNLTGLETVEKSNLVAAINEIRRALATHLADKASKTTYGHVKIGSGINVVDGEISVSEMTATNVSTTQGPSVQETLDTLKSDTDNKINSVRDAIVDRKGTVAGNPPTAVQLVAGVNSIPSGRKEKVGSVASGTGYARIELDFVPSILLLGMRGSTSSWGKARIGAPGTLFYRLDSSGNDPFDSFSGHPVATYVPINRGIIGSGYTLDYRFIE